MILIIHLMIGKLPDKKNQREFPRDSSSIEDFDKIPPPLPAQNFL